MAETVARVSFLHPDLGIGGAERLVVDAALALQKRGCAVKMYTSHHDPSHCFPETKDGSVNVTVYGDWLPRHIFGRMFALCAYIRMCYLALAVLLLHGRDVDVYFCDQISACIPLLRIFSSARILFYCHFPDQLLTARATFWKSLYRKPLDWFEQYTTGCAHHVMVNSQFTGGVFQKTFRSLTIRPNVVYPSLNFEAFDKTDIPKADVPGQIVFLSLNRYERKKNLLLAIQALAALREKLTAKQYAQVHLVMAGGYDERVSENVEHLEELKEAVRKADLQSKVTFLCSISEMTKLSLLQQCSALLYTPSNEHFGITPLEAMYMQRPVIAVNSGGPLETVADALTGYLCEPEPDAFAEKMATFVRTPALSGTMGARGRTRVVERFSFDAFADSLLDSVLAVLGRL
eukprot:m.93758 g.93758  ORF g.93758 m.93758 type:complete len:404 (-) comp15384_c0_seq1:124-1335(-)